MKIDIVDKSILYQGHLSLAKYTLRHELFSGGLSEILIREICEARAAVGVLLFDPDRDEIVLTEEFRLGALEHGNPWLLQIVAGLIEIDEPVEAVAQREAQEEAGCEILDLIPMINYWTSPGISTGRFDLLCGRIDSRNKGGIFGLSEEHEDIRAQVFSKEYVYNALKTGEICNSATIIAVQWLQLHELEVKAKWR